MRFLLFLTIFTMLSTSHRLLPAAEEGITLPAGTWELHGSARLRGQSTAENFWLRLLPSDLAFGHNRVLQIVYTPPVPAVLGGTHLFDTPFLLMDPQSRLMAWNDRGSNSLMQPAVGMYVVSRDRTPSDHTNIVIEEKKITVNRGWDRSVTPLLLALLWRTESTASLPCVDLFGDEPTTTLAWHGSTIICGSDTWQVTADAQGHLVHLRDAQGVDLVTVSQWLACGTPAAPSAKSEPSAGAK